MPSKLEIEYLDYCFTATLEIRESGRTGVVDWRLESASRSKTLAWIVFDRFLERHDFADEEEARANIVDWLERLADPRSGASVEIAKANAVAVGAVATGASTESTAEIVGETVIDVASDLDWIEMVAEWLFS
ncbi:hypothetical protein BLA13014_02562 [Burkholderia aenigmatica]|uniref:Uncharacterized protein n=1 Tax=Burkholderia aenigmatica TaxID=2015348 RepID=A0A6P2KTM2_9BURK|nr:MULTISPECIES: hypothetical protein [Burkholderia]MDN7519199.1 hypothetical protein [Burkholderia sp. AU45251]VWB57840.1 hypothetical protein BLA13014_02562 [Burkholderia aenigmatica]HDR9483559.1 hypothetical protein [Burkholderia aenigmatica]HDR9488524.1 hypothetical protein [Burkholderia aenigmatica]HDR9514508.1 hypothetical protein [Burkholderia aenigmatica]